MDNNQMLEMIRQYQQGGKDISTLLNDCDALLAARKTPIGLNRWQHSDKPTMEQFNEDNRVINDAISELNRDKVNKESITKFPLSYTTGYSGYGYYYRNQLGEVTVVVSFSASSIAAGAVVAVLPTGFRPDRILELPTVYMGSSVSIGTIYINNDGHIKVQVYDPSAKHTYATSSSITYPAVQ